MRDDTDDDEQAAEPIAASDPRSAAAAFKRAAERAAPHVFHLWPEHVDALHAWLSIQTQWREGFNGPTGLDYAGVTAWARIAGLRAGALRERFDQMQIMERAALHAWAERRQQKTRG